VSICWCFAERASKGKAKKQWAEDGGEGGGAIMTIIIVVVVVVVVAMADVVGSWIW
jgi:flagellar basal body-associated protein FliL